MNTKIILLVGTVLFALLELVFHPWDIPPALYLALGLISMVVLIWRRWTLIARGMIQLGFFVVGEAALFCNRGPQCQNCVFSLGICPIGTVQRIAFIQDVPFYVPLAVIGVLGVVVGSFTCGWVCPVGFVQDLFSAVNIKKLSLPRIVGPVRYFFLAGVAFLVFLEMNGGFLSARGWFLFSLPVIVFGFIILMSAFVINRPLCRLACPVGLLYGLLNKVSLSKIPTDWSFCRDCGRCEKNCVTGLDPRKDLNGPACVKCYGCAPVCPVK